MGARLNFFWQGICPLKLDVGSFGRIRPKLLEISAKIKVLEMHFKGVEMHFCQNYHVLKPIVPRGLGKEGMGHPLTSFTFDFDTLKLRLLRPQFCKK